jgi:hypothetical protein
MLGWNLNRCDYRAHCHVLVLALEVNGIAILFYFKVYEHKGILSKREEVDFIRSLIFSPFCRLVNHAKRQKRCFSKANWRVNQSFEEKTGTIVS